MANENQTKGSVVGLVIGITGFVAILALAYGIVEFVSWAQNYTFPQLDPLGLF